MIKKYILLVLVCELFFAQANLAFAADSTYDYSTAGVSTQIEQFLCAPSKTPTNGDLYNCINRLYRFSLILASVIAVFFIVIAGYLYMSAEGNQEAVDKAKSILTSSITALVILFAGYILLKAINPDLVQFQTIQPPSVVGPAAGAVGADVQAAAKNIQSNSKIAVNSTGCNCTGNCPNKTLADLAAGNKAQFDGPGVGQQGCNSGTTSVNLTMLSALLTAANEGNSFTITSITGGHHSNTSDPHYQGKAVDVVPNPPTTSAQVALVGSLRQNGASKIGLECSAVSGGFLTLDGSNDASGACIGKDGYHIHAQW